MRKKRKPIASFRNPFNFVREDDLDTPSYEQKENEKIEENESDKNIFEDSRQFDIPSKRKKTKRRGRPKKAKGTKRDSKITFCCTETEARTIKLYAFERDLSVSEFIMRCVYQHLNK